MCLVALLAPHPAIFAASSDGVVAGRVTVDGRPLAGVDLSFVHVETGAVHSFRSGPDGSYEARLTPGAYVVSGGADVGAAVGRAPALVQVQLGQVASANLELVSLALPAAQDAPAGGGVAIQHEPNTCLLAGEFPMFDGIFTPPTSVVRARLYFRSGLSDEWYFVEMAQTLEVAPSGGFRGWMPRPQPVASPISYYLQATTTDFGESRTPEISAIVVEDESECGDRKLAAYGQPPAGLTVFSAATGASIAVPVGFAAGGVAIGTGAIIAIVAGAAAAGLGVSQIGDGTPTPTATPPAQTPTPTPVPTPTTIGPFFLDVLISPPGFGVVDVVPPQPPDGYRDGTRVTLTASPDVIPASPPEIVRFVRWEGDCASFGPDPVCTLVMNSNKTAIAVFTSSAAPLRR